MSNGVAAKSRVLFLQLSECDGFAREICFDSRLHTSGDHKGGIGTSEKGEARGGARRGLRVHEKTKQLLREVQFEEWGT